MEWVIFVLYVLGGLLCVDFVSVVGDHPESKVKADRAVKVIVFFAWPLAVVYLRVR